MKPDSWREAFREYGMDMEEMATRQYALEDKLPWDHLGFGVTKAFLQEEYHKALQAVLTPDCRFGLCAACGVCGVSGSLNRLHGEMVVDS